MEAGLNSPHARASQNESSYPALQTNTLNYDKLEKYRLPDHSPDKEVEINLSNPLIKDSLMKYVVYTITGKDVTGTFEAYRRYKDFIALRKLLIRHWPGCVIPKIPPKQALGNLENNFIEQRRKLLEVFLLKVANTPYLHQSEEFHMFLRGPSEYHKAIANFRRQTYDQLAASYQSTFPESAEFQIHENSLKELDESYQYFISNQTTLEMFHGKCKMCVDYFGFYKKELLGMFQGLKDVNKHYLVESKEMQFDNPGNDINPYSGLLDWIRSELLDLGGMIEAFQKKKEYERVKQKVVERIDAERKNLLNLQLDKKTLLQIISRKPKEYFTDKISKNIQVLEGELKSLEIINNIIAGHLLQMEIPKFRQSKSHSYEAVVRKLADLSITELEFIIAQTQKVEESLN